MAATTDTIADMLTRIRNACSQNHETVDIPASNIKKTIANILLEEGYIKSVENIEDGKQGVIRVVLKYFFEDKNISKKKNAIMGIKRVSKPGTRVYVDKDNLPKVIGGLGIAIISTSHGVMTAKVAKKEGIGGEVLAYVW